MEPKPGRVGASDGRVGGRAIAAPAMLQVALCRRVACRVCESYRLHGRNDNISQMLYFLFHCELTLGSATGT